MPLKIGLCAPYDLARSGGVNNQVRAQARALRRLGHHVTVFGPASAPLPEGEVAVCGSVSITVSGTESGLGISPLGIGRVARLLSEQPFDILHVHEPLTPLLPWFVLLAARVPLVGTFHVYREHGHPFYPVGWPILAPLMHRLSHRIAVSEAARHTIARYFRGDYEILPNGIEVDSFREPRLRPPDVQANEQHVLYVGRLEPRKGIEYLIRAMAAVASDRPRVRLLLVGDGPLRNALRSLANELGVDVVFAGRVSDEELPAYFQWCDVVASPAVGGESFGIVLLEAMACGRPIVATEIDGYRALVEGTGAGLLVPPADTDALRRALLELLDNETIRRELGARGIATAAEYDWPRLARRLVAIYERLLTPSSSARLA